MTVPDGGSNDNVIKWRLDRLEGDLAQRQSWTERQFEDVKRDLKELASCLAGIKLELGSRGRWDRLWAAVVGGIAGALPAFFAAWAAFRSG